MNTGRALALAAWGAALTTLCTAALAQSKTGDIQGQRAPEQVYAKVCGYCHGRNVGPVILGRHLPADAVTYVVRHGQNGMPAFRPTEISPAELEALAAWVAAADARKEEHGQ